MQIAVGGCLAQKDRGEITRRAPWVDVVFGTHNIGSLPVLLERARVQEEAQVEILESLEVFPSTLPTQRESAYAAWVSISRRLQQHLHVLHRAGLRGKEKDRRPGDVLAEIRALVAEGVSEVTLLGQNVNSYGVEFGDRLAFGKLLRACGEIEGLERVRFTSPHPADFTDDVIAAMAETPNVMPQLHMPLQSGSDRVLQGDAPLLPAGEVPRHHRPGPRRDAGRRDHHRHHRRLPRRDRGGLPRDDARSSSRRGSPARSRSSTPSAPAPRPPCSTSRCRKAVVQERYERLVDAGRRHRLGREQAAGRPHRRAAGRRGRGPQGRRDPPAVRPGPRQPARALRAGRRARQTVDVRPATWSRSRSPTPRRTTWSPTARSGAYAGRGPATPGRPAPPHPRGRGSPSGCPRSGCPLRRPRRPAVAEPTGDHGGAVRVALPRRLKSSDLIDIRALRGDMTRTFHWFLPTIRGDHLGHLAQDPLRLTPRAQRARRVARGGLPPARRAGRAALRRPRPADHR